MTEKWMTKKCLLAAIYQDQHCNFYFSVSHFSVNHFSVIFADITV